MACRHKPHGVAPARKCRSYPPRVPCGALEGRPRTPVRTPEPLAAPALFSLFVLGWASWPGAFVTGRTTA